jgi:preprotein translocase subunit SecD
LRQNLFATLIGIALVTVLALYVVFADTIGIGDWQRDVHTRLGLDLRGGLQLVLQAEQRGAQAVTNEQLDAARRIIEDRAAGVGASEPIVQVDYENKRIIVELPEVERPEEARAVIQTTAFLEIVDGGTNALPEGALITTSNGPPRPEQFGSRLNTPTAVPQATGTVTSTTQITGTNGVTGTVTIAPATPAASPTAIATATGATTPGAAPTPTPFLGIVFNTIVTGEDLIGSQVAVTFDPNTNQPQVAFALQGEASNRFCSFTQSNIGRFMPILLDKEVISSPQIQGAICGGNGVITGVNLEEARVLAQQLKYGALPVSLVVFSERRISATLGQDAIDRSIVAGAIGLGMVVLFMVAYYRLPGVLASLALVVYSLVSLAVFELVPVTLTLAGIAGFILSIGMAVDANVLIFARLKEEIRAGKTLPAAVEAGFDHAWPSIRDSNASTLITCAILFWFGSTFGGASIIRGFALTLAIGVIVSLFSAITVTRTFLRAIVRTGLANNKWAFNLETKRSAAPTTATEAQ